MQVFFTRLALFLRSVYADNLALDRHIADVNPTTSAPDLIRADRLHEILRRNLPKRFGKNFQHSPSLLPKYPGLHTYGTLIEVGEDGTLT